MKALLLKSIIVFTVVLVFIATSATAQQYDTKYPPEDGLSLFKLKDKYGYFDENNKVAIPCEFDDANSFSDGLAGVKKAGKWAYIDRSGSLLIPYQFEQAAGFLEGLAQVKLNGKFGFINKLGKTVIPFKYEEASYFSNGLAPVKQNGVWGCIDNTGSTIIPFKYTSCGPYRDGLVCVSDAERKHGYVDINGNTVISPQYQSAFNFYEGLAFVRLNKKWGAIDKKGKLIVPMQYDFPHNFEGGYAMVENDGKWGAIDKTGKEVVPVVYGFLDAVKKKKAIASGKPITDGVTKTNDKPTVVESPKSSGAKTVKNWSAISSLIKKPVTAMQDRVRKENFSLSSKENQGSLTIYHYNDVSDKYWVQGQGEVNDNYTVVELNGHTEAVSFSIMARKSAGILDLMDMNENFKMAILADGFSKYDSKEHKFGEITHYKNKSRQLTIKLEVTSALGFPHVIDVYVYGEGVKMD